MYLFLEIQSPSARKDKPKLGNAILGDCHPPRQFKSLSPE